MAWHAARREEKRVYALMDENRARAERRKAAHEAKMTDPVQMLRVAGRASVPVLDAERFYANETGKNVAPWVLDRDATIDRFDARNLLDFVPEWSAAGGAGVNVAGGVVEDEDEEDKVQFERYRDIVDAEMHGRPDHAVIRTIDDQWTAHLVVHSKAGAAAAASPASGPGTEYLNPDSLAIAPTMSDVTTTTMYMPALQRQMDVLGAQYGVRKWSELVGNVERREERERRGRKSEEKRKDKLRERRLNRMENKQKHKRPRRGSRGGGSDTGEVGDTELGAGGSDGSRSDSRAEDVSDDSGDSTSGSETASESDSDSESGEGSLTIEFAKVEAVPSGDVTVEDISSASDTDADKPPTIPTYKPIARSPAPAPTPSPPFTPATKHPSLTTTPVVQSARDRLRKAALADEGGGVMGREEQGADSQWQGVAEVVHVQFKKAKRPAASRGGVKPRSSAMLGTGSPPEPNTSTVAPAPVPAAGDVVEEGARPGQGSMESVKNERERDEDHQGGLRRSGRRGSNRSKSPYRTKGGKSRSRSRSRSRTRRRSRSRSRSRSWRRSSSHEGPRRHLIHQTTRRHQHTDRHSRSRSWSRGRSASPAGSVSPRDSYRRGTDGAGWKRRRSPSSASDVVKRDPCGANWRSDEKKRRQRERDRS
ncbi:hypothetical protein M427DRAFT_356919 [Gonapodya prolifera JEL478]|uniref:Suppressor of white apricot N-terminal domain-containing protein n=1 Tax=Gonapodya prolifera (strain JEL478) TaxID=1344416 RepID=A0A139AB86_GONPJ|nr:hypothetical protein M427DRAFT_356919 [Gonapodya prolifera JEL478]|eukprot:KXS14010.1 hypothetical protein M427DRAFT_356919 [Gonapodya prolifera JEL478]